MVIHAKASFGRAKQTHGRERFSRPRSETIERKLRLLSGLDVHKDVVVFLFGALSLPIEVRRVALWHRDVRPTGKDWVLFSAPSTKQEVLHAIHFVELGRVHMPVKDDDVQVFGVRGNRFVGILVFRDGAHAGAAEGWVVESDEDLLDRLRLCFIQPHLELLHLFFVRGAGGTPACGPPIFVWSCPLNDYGGG